MTRSDELDAKFAQAEALRQQGKLAEAERLYEELLRVNPRHFDALHQLGIVNLKLGKNERGATLIGQALAIEPNAPVAQSNLGFALSVLNRPAEALAHFDKAIALRPDYAQAHNNRAHALNALRRPDDALASANRALALKPDYAEAARNREIALAALENTVKIYDDAAARGSEQADVFYNRGNSLIALKRNEEALASFDSAIAIEPGHLKAYNNRGATLIEMQRYGDAVASFDAAIVLNPDSAAAHNNRAHALNALRRHEEALAGAERAIALNANYTEAHNIRGNALNALRRHEEALESYARVIALKPDYAEAYYNSGVALGALRRHADALLQYDKAIAINPGYARAHGNRGATLVELRRLDEALPSFERAMAIDPDIDFLLASYLYTKMKICDWTGLQEQQADLIGKIADGKAVASPFILLAISDSLEVQRKAAAGYARITQPVDGLLPAITPRKTPNRKIRLGYFSATFHDHAAALWVAELFEKHDGDRFERIGFSFGPDKADPVRKRLAASFDRFFDLRDKTDKQIAQMARDLEIDIAVDLMGYTEDGRPNVFVHRAAPIQVSYMGFPGTLGSTHHDYLIADATLIPTNRRAGYSEKIVTMPNSYMANDTKRPAQETNLTRAQAGLPEKSFVFCCFNNNFKIAPETFDSWMRILKRVDGSVLWLLADNKSVPGNLQREAAARGVDPSRLVFAPRMQLAHHLARHRLAELFLDTQPYNAHTTASDALWLGLPVLTLIGETFVSRVAASTLHAIGIPELITHSRAQFEALAADLATSKWKLASLKAKLAQNRLTTPLFDIALFTRHIEAAYAMMMQRHRGGLPPDHIDVPADV